MVLLLYPHGSITTRLSGYIKLEQKSEGILQVQELNPIENNLIFVLYYWKQMALLLLLVCAGKRMHDGPSVAECSEAAELNVHNI